MTTLYAQPYDISASGFYFKTQQEYDAKASNLRNDYGQIVEEFEIQFIDGENLDAELFEALSVSQCSFGDFFDVIEQWTEDQKIKVILAVKEMGYGFNIRDDNPDKFDIDLYQLRSLRDLAVQFVDEGLFGDIPEALENYLDYDAIARDLSMDYSQAVVDETMYIFRGR